MSYCTCHSADIQDGKEDIDYKATFVCIDQNEM